jgi:hypothetical protein
VLMQTFLRLAVLAIIAAYVVSALAMMPARALDDDGLVLLWIRSKLWQDPASKGTVVMTLKIYEGCQGVDEDDNPFFNLQDMTWAYVVENLSYDPIPGITNGFSGFQILFPVKVPELYNQQPPAIGGPWRQNAFSGQFPPSGVEWDVPRPGVGIMPGETGSFSFCTHERLQTGRRPSASTVGEGDGGWAHTWGWLVEEEIVYTDGSVSSDTGLPGAQEVSVLHTPDL